MTPGWREAAGRSDLAGALAGAIDVGREDYEALHERRAPARELPAPRPFAIAGRGVRYDKSWQDVGVPHYRVNEE